MLNSNTRDRKKQHSLTWVKRLQYANLLFLVLICLPTYPCVKVLLETINVDVKPMPIVFSQNVSLICEIHTETKPAHMAWIRIPQGQTLAFNTISSNPSKYNVRMTHKQDKMEYNLTIINFDQSDVNILYRCDSGFYSYPKYLQLNDKDYIAIPSDDQILKSIVMIGNILHVNITLVHVYPEPVCSLTFGEANLTDKLEVTKENNSVFYNYSLKLKTATTNCNENVTCTVICRVGIKTIKMSENINTASCEDKKAPIAVIIIMVMILIITTITMIKVLVVYRRITIKRKEISLQVPVSVELSSTEVPANIPETDALATQTDNLAQARGRSDSCSLLSNGQSQDAERQ